MSARRKEEKLRYRQLHESVLGALREADPIGLDAMGAPAEEYALEVGTILPRLRSANSDSDVARIVHEEFSHWFGEDLAGPEEKYARVGTAIWRAWLAGRGGESTG